MCSHLWNCPLLKPLRTSMQFAEYCLIKNRAHFNNKTKISDSATSTFYYTFVWRLEGELAFCSAFLVTSHFSTTWSVLFLVQKSKTLRVALEVKKGAENTTISVMFQQLLSILCTCETWDAKLLWTWPQKTPHAILKNKIKIGGGCREGERKKMKDHQTVSLHAIRWCSPALNAGSISQKAYFLFELINNTFQSQEPGRLWSPTLLPHTGRWCALLIRACSPIMWHWGVRVSERLYVWS